MQVELNGKKVYAVNKAAPQLPINVEDAARSEEQIAAGEAVSLQWCWAASHTQFEIWVFYMRLLQLNLTLSVQQ